LKEKKSTAAVAKKPAVPLLPTQDDPRLASIPETPTEDLPREPIPSTIGTPPKHDPQDGSSSSSDPLAISVCSVSDDRLKGDSNYQVYLVVSDFDTIINWSSLIVKGYKGIIKHIGVVFVDM